MLKERKIRNNCTRIFSFVNSNWAICLSFVSLISIFLGYLIFHVSPLYTFQEIEYNQQQNNLKRELVQFHNDLGTSFLYVEQFDAARNEFNKTLEIDPLNRKARMSLFECDVFNEATGNNRNYDPEIVEKELQALLKMNSSDPLPYLYLGDFFCNNNNTETALDYYQKAIKLDNSVAAAYAGMGIIYYGKNKTDNAIEMFEKAYNLSNWNIAYRGNIAYIYYQKRDYKKALNWYNSIFILQNKYLEPYYGYSNSYRCLGDLENAREIQEAQINFLEDNVSKNLIINQDSFYYFANSGRTIFLYDYNEKKIYAYYNLALTYHLLGDKRKTLEYMKKANDLHINKDSEFNIKEILNSDIEELQEEQPNLKDRIAEFRNKIE
jgi:tetratricopeptide (TPR) repeat protein